MKSFLNLSLFKKILIVFGFIFFSGFFLRTYVLSENIKELSLKNNKSQMFSINYNISTLIKQKAELFLKERLIENMNEFNKKLMDEYHHVLMGKKNEGVIREELKEELLKIHIGKEGYAYILDSDWNVIVHPVKEYIGQNFAHRDDLKPDFSRKHGFIKYTWQTPGQPEKRPKLVYLSYFEPWDWIICVSAYFDENIIEIGKELFQRSKNIGDLFKYESVILDSNGVVVYHPYLTGSVRDVIDTKGKRYFSEILKQKNGTISFFHKAPGQKEEKKIAVFSEVGIFDWIIITSASEAKLLRDSKNIIDMIIKVSTILLIIGIVLAWLLSKMIVRPLNCLSKSMKLAMKGDYTIRCRASILKDEIGELAISFNHLLERFQKEIKNREEVENILEFNEKRYRIQYRNIPIPTFTWKYDNGRFFLIDRNEFAENLLKKLGKQKNLMDAQHIFDDDDEIIQKMKICKETNRMVVFEASIWQKEMNIWIAFIEDNLILMQMEDFTEKNEAHRKILKLNQELEAFAFSVSHDMKTPINTLSWYIDIIEKGLGSIEPEQLEEYIDDMKENILHMRKKVENILRISTIKEKDLKIEKIDLSKLAKTIIEEHKNYHIDNFDLNIHDDMVLKADYGFTVILMDNLISNALKFSSRRDKPYLEIGFSEEKEAFFIKDNGPGFDVKEASRLFDVGVRLHKEEGYTGSGIGLSLVKKVVEVHRGKIWVESEPGSGTTFYFVL